MPRGREDDEATGREVKETKGDAADSITPLILLIGMGKIDFFRKKSFFQVKL